MRTQPRDQDGTITFGAVTGVAPTSGVAQPGAIPYTVTRSGTGTSRVEFDKRLMALHIESVGTVGSGPIAAPSAVSAGGFNMTTTTDAGVAADVGYRWICTARDQRT